MSAQKKKGKKSAPRGLVAFTESGTVPRWVSAARVVMILGFASALPVILGIERGRQLFWAAAIAALPLLWVVGGYHLWRRICPLAAFAQLGRYMGLGGERRISGKLASHYMLLQLGLMIAALSLRLVMTNGTRWALVGFVIAVIVFAAVTGFIWTGKTWCNYICPVGMVEKIYTEPIRLAGGGNSQCKPCTACKKNCPDIDLEQGYWKEIDLDARRIAYFSWPGLVFAFYLYYYLVAGSWSYYFTGVWTREDSQMSRWLEPGLFFFDKIPIAAAAPLVLIAAAALSYAVFSAGERVALAIARPRSTERPTDEDTIEELVRHRTLALAGFVGFITFYFYGGQPTIRMLPGWFGALFSVAVVIAASAIFFRRWSRSEADFVKEKFAEKILKKWEWGDEPPAENLQDIYLLHSERTKEREQRLQAYKETVRDMVADGLVTKNELVLLDSLRAQLGVTDRDHKRVLAQLSEEERQLFDPGYQGSLEQRLQSEQYQRELSRLVVSAARLGRVASPDSLAALRAEYQVTAEEETVAVELLLRTGGPVAELLDTRIAAISRLGEARRLAARDDDDSASVEFFCYLCLERGRELAADALNLLTPLTGATEPLSESVDLRSTDAGIAALEDIVGPPAEPLTSALRELLDTEPDEPGDQTEGLEPDRRATADVLLELSGDSSRHLRAASVHLLSRFDDEPAKAAVIAATDDDEPLVREAAYNALQVRGRLGRELATRAAGDPDHRVRNAARPAASKGASVPPGTVAAFATLDAGRAIESLTSLEKMMLLRQAPLLASLEPADLEELTPIANERRYDPGESLCRQGDEGEEVFLIISGEVEVWTQTEGVDERRILDTLGAGACIGEMAVLDSAPRSAFVTASRPTRALILDGSDFKSLLTTRPAMSQRIIEDLVGRMRRLISARPAG
jgi:hypothetical protein